MALPNKILKKKREIAFLIVNNINKILENSTLCVGLTACSRFTAGFRQQLLMIYCLAWFRPGSAEERKSHISKSQVTCQSPMLICLLCHLMNENCKVTWQVSSHGKMKPRKMWPFSYKAWILSRVFKLQVLYTAAVNNGVIAEWKKLQRVKVRKLYSDHLFQKQFTFWWARVRLICKKNPLWNPLIVKNLLVPSEFGCKVCNTCCWPIYTWYVTVSSPRTGCGDPGSTCISAHYYSAELVGGETNKMRCVH